MASPIIISSTFIWETMSTSLAAVQPPISCRIADLGTLISTSIRAISSDGVFMACSATSMLMEWLAIKESIRSNVEVNLDIYFPKYRPFFKKILIDEKDRIYVTRLKSILDSGNDESIDVFSKDGEYLYTVAMPFVPRIIKDGFIYFIEKTLGKDDDYVYKAKSYKIKEMKRDSL